MAKLLSHIYSLRFDKPLGYIRAVGFKQRYLINHLQHGKIVIDGRFGRGNACYIGFIQKTAASWHDDVKNLIKALISLSLPTRGYLFHIGADIGIKQSALPSYGVYFLNFGYPPLRIALRRVS